MKAYQNVRKEGEEYCLSKNLNCTFIRPWYVLGPEHRWPLLLLSLYGIASLIPSNTLMKAVESKPEKKRIIEIEEL